MATPRADRTFTTTLRAVSGAAILFALGAFVRFGSNAGLSTFLGGAAAVLNLLAMKTILGGVIGGTVDGDLGKGKTWGTLAVLKLFGLMVGVALLLIRGVAAPIPFLCGYLALPVGIVIGALLSGGRSRGEPGEE